MVDLRLFSHFRNCIPNLLTFYYVYDIIITGDIMKYIKRTIEEKLISMIDNYQVIMITGPRQVGKSTLFNQITQGRKEAVLTLNCDEPEVKEMLANINTSELKMLIGNNRIIVIDEAQRVSEIGLTLKRITDNFTNV